MWPIEAHGRQNPTVNYDASSGGGRPLTLDSTEYALVSLGLTLKCMDSWLQSFKKNYLCRTTIFCDQRSESFKKIPVTILEHKPDDFKNKRQLMLKYIGGKWHTNKLRYKPFTIRIPRLSK